MFIISKRNFLVRRADGSPYLVKKDFIGDIPGDVYQSGIIQGAIRGGLISAPQSHRDKDLYAADENAQEKEQAADIRPDANPNEKDLENDELNTSEDETEQKKASRSKK